MTSISGGQLSHVAACIKTKAQDTSARHLKNIILIAGANDISIRHHGTQLVANGLRSMEKGISLVKSTVRKELPHVKFRVVDPIPRDSVDGKHVHVCYRLGCLLKCHGDEILDPNIAHVKLGKLFFTTNRAYRGKSGPQDVQRFVLRPQLFGDDGVHLSAQGLKILKQVVLWQCKEDTAPTLKVDITIREGIVVSKTLNMS